MSKVLVVDDDAHIRELVRIFLEREGLDVYEAANGREALTKLEKVRADLVILDVMMPEMDGWELCRRLRQGGDLPLLILTAKGETNDKVKGFQLGSDDYLVKRYRIATSQMVRVGDLAMNRKTHELCVGQQTLTVPLKEFELLFELASHAGRTLSRSALIEGIWGYDFEGNERKLDVHINRL